MIPAAVLISEDTGSSGFLNSDGTCACSNNADNDDIFTVKVDAVKLNESPVSSNAVGPLNACFAGKVTSIVIISNLLDLRKVTCLHFYLIYCEWLNQAQQSKLNHANIISKFIPGFKRHIPVGYFWRLLVSGGYAGWCWLPEIGQAVFTADLAKCSLVGVIFTRPCLRFILEYRLVHK